MFEMISSPVSFVDVEYSNKRQVRYKCFIENLNKESYVFLTQSLSQGVEDRTITMEGGDKCTVVCQPVHSITLHYQDKQKTPDTYQATVFISKDSSLKETECYMCLQPILH